MTGTTDRKSKWARHHWQRINIAVVVFALVNELSVGDHYVSDFDINWLLRMGRMQNVFHFVFYKARDFVICNNFYWDNSLNLS